jgi:hypothetical protein
MKATDPLVDEASLLLEDELGLLAELLLIVDELLPLSEDPPPPAVPELALELTAVLPPASGDALLLTGWPPVPRDAPPSVGFEGLPSTPQLQTQVPTSAVKRRV